MTEELEEKYRVDTAVIRGGWPLPHYGDAGNVIHRLCDEIDKMRLALSRGWTLAQYEYADDHDLWAAHAGDGTADD
jgi:hypothetical protein